MHTALSVTFLRTVPTSIPISPFHVAGTVFLIGAASAVCCYEETQWLGMCRQSAVCTSYSRGLSSVGISRAAQQTRLHPGGFFTGPLQHVNQLRCTPGDRLDLKYVRKWLRDHSVQLGHGLAILAQEKYKKAGFIHRS